MIDLSHLSDDELLAELDRLFALPSSTTPRVKAMLSRALDILECAA